MTWPWARLKEAGLVRGRTTQRTDSTHVLAAVRDLTRLELITEAVRSALEEVARTTGHVLDGLADDEWGRRYGRPHRLALRPGRALLMASRQLSHNDQDPRQSQEAGDTSLTCTDEFSAHAASRTNVLSPATHTATSERAGQPAWRRF